jgi:hypothetical protein
LQPWVLFLILYGAVAVVVFFSARRMNADIDAALTAAVVCSGGLAAITYLLTGGGF